MQACRKHTHTRTHNRDGVGRNCSFSRCLCHKPAPLDGAVERLILVSRNKQDRRWQQLLLKCCLLAIVLFYFFFFVFTCVCSFWPRAALLEALAAPHLHQLSVQRVQHIPVHRVHRVGQLGERKAHHTHRSRWCFRHKWISTLNTELAHVSLVSCHWEKEATADLKNCCSFGQIWTIGTNNRWHDLDSR